MKSSVSIHSVLIELFSGYSFRSKVVNDPGGDMEVIQMKDLEDGYSRIGNELTKVDSSTIRQKYVLQKGDILFLAKGANNYAIEYDLDLPKAVAASAFFVLRPDLEKIIPGYLAWYINQKTVQQYLKENTAGTYIPNINKNTILGINIQLPEKEIQEKVVKIEFLRKREYLLTSELLFKREKLISYKLLKMIN